MFHKIASVLYVNYCYNVLKDSLEVQIEIHPFKNQVDAELLISAVWDKQHQVTLDSNFRTTLYRKTVTVHESNSTQITQSEQAICQNSGIEW